jgi:hypothetical protein
MFSTVSLSSNFSLSSVPKLQKSVMIDSLSGIQTSTLSSEWKILSCPLQFGLNKLKLCRFLALSVSRLLSGNYSQFNTNFASFSVHLFSSKLIFATKFDICGWNFSWCLFGTGSFTSWLLNCVLLCFAYCSGFPSWLMRSFFQVEGFQSLERIDGYFLSVFIFLGQRFFVSLLYWGSSCTSEKICYC